ncbi:MAG: response regulator [Opitutales bacterium]|nr:response regulator [Opitutales bacterium]
MDTTDPAMMNEVAVFPIRIAIVEDEPSVAEALSDLLDARGYDVEIYNCPMRALRALTLERFDGLLLDYRMPNLNGRQFFEKARRRGITIPTVLVSGFVDETRLTEMVNLGLCRFLQKPARAEALFETLESLGLGPGRALARRAEWEEWRDHWRALIRVDEASNRGACLAGIPWKRFEGAPARTPGDRNLICSVLHGWETGGTIALSGPTGSDFVPLLRELVPVLRPNVTEIVFLDGTASDFAEAAADAERRPTLYVGVFRSAEKLAEVSGSAAPGGPAVGYILETEAPAAAGSGGFFEGGLASCVLPPLRERPEAVAHYLAVHCAVAGAEPGAEAAAALLAYGWPGNYNELAAVLDAVALAGRGGPVAAGDVEAALRSVSGTDFRFGSAALRVRLRADLLGPLLREVSDDAVAATLAGIPAEQIDAARKCRSVLDAVDTSRFALSAGRTVETRRATP